MNDKLIFLSAVNMTDEETRELGKEIKPYIDKCNFDVILTNRFVKPLDKEELTNILESILKRLKND